VPFGDRAQGLEQLEFFGGFEVLVPQLDDVHAAAERRIEELPEVALPFPGIGAQVQLGSLQIFHGAKPTPQVLPKLVPRLGALGPVGPSRSSRVHSEIPGRATLRSFSPGC